MSIYWRRVHGRAVHDARGTLGIESRERAVLVIITAAVSVVVIWTLGGSDAALGEILAKTGATAAILLAFPFVYVWKFLTAPAKLQREAEEALDRLKSEADAQRKSGLRLRIASAQSDPNAPSEFYIDYVLSNEGIPSIATSWELHIILRSGNRLPNLVPRVVGTGFWVKDAFGHPEPEDISLNPLGTGARREGRLTFTLSAVDTARIAGSEAEFVLTVMDAKGRIAKASYVGPATSRMSPSVQP